MKDDGLISNLDLNADIPPLANIQPSANSHQSMALLPRVNVPPLHIVGYDFTESPIWAASKLFVSSKFAFMGELVSHSGLPRTGLLIENVPYYTMNLVEYLHSGQSPGQVFGSVSQDVVVDGAIYYGMKQGIQLSTRLFGRSLGFLSRNAGSVATGAILVLDTAEFVAPHIENTWLNNPGLLGGLVLTGKAWGVVNEVVSDGLDFGISGAFEILKNSLKYKPENDFDRTVKDGKVYLHATPNCMQQPKRIPLFDIKMAGRYLDGLAGPFLVDVAVSAYEWIKPKPVDFGPRLEKRDGRVYLETGSMPNVTDELSPLISKTFSLVGSPQRQPARFLPIFNFSCANAGLEIPQLQVPQALDVPALPHLNERIDAQPPDPVAIQPYFLQEPQLAGGYVNPWLMGNDTGFFYGGFSNSNPYLFAQTPPGPSLGAMPYSADLTSGIVPTLQPPVSSEALAELTSPAHIVVEEKPLADLEALPPLAQINVSSLSTGGSVAEPKLTALGTIRPDTHSVPGGVYVGAISINNSIGIHYGIGFEFQNLDAIVTRAINGWISKTALTTDRVRLQNGDYCSYEIRTVSFEASQIEIKARYLRAQNQGVGNSHHLTVDLGFSWNPFHFGYNVNSDANKARIAAEISAVSGQCVIGEYQENRKHFLENINLALAQGNDAKAHSLHAEFFGKFRVFSDEVKRDELATLRQINDALDVRLFTQAMGAVEREDFIAANNLCASLHNATLQQQARTAIGQDAVSAGNPDAALTICESIPPSEQRTQLEKEARKSKVESCSMQILQELRDDEAYVDLWERIDERRDDHKKQQILRGFLGEAEDALTEEAYDECSTIMNGKRRAQFLFTLAQHQHGSAKSAEGLELAAEGFRRALEVDPSHRDATKLLSNCYLRQGKFQEAIDLVDVHILVAQPGDVFGLSVKGAALLRTQNRAAGRAILTELLERGIEHHADLPESRPDDEVVSTVTSLTLSEAEIQFVHSEMASDYAREVHENQRDYLTNRVNRRRTYQSANNTGKKIETLQNEVDQSRQHLASMDLTIKQRNAHAAEIKSFEKSDDVELQIQRDQAEKQLHTDNKLLQSTMDHFNIQVVQITTDAIFFLADVAISQLWWREANQQDEQGKCKLTDGGVKLQKGLKLFKAPLSSGLQLLAHDAYWTMSASDREVQAVLADSLQHSGFSEVANVKPESAFSVRLNYARYALLGGQMFREFMRWIERDEKDRPTNREEWSALERTGKFMDEYALPIAQMGLSLGFIALSPGNPIAGILSFSPEIVMQIPEINNYLLRPNPRDHSARVRFIIGKTLERMNSNNKKRLTRVETVLGDATQVLSYVTAFPEPLSMLFRSLLSTAFTGAVIDGLFNCFTRLGKLYLLFKTGQLALAFYHTYKNYSPQWLQHCFVSLQQEFNQQMHALRTQTPQQNSLTFKRIKEDLRGLFAQTPVVNAELRKFYILTVYFEHFFSSIREFGVTPADGNCLFHAISQYCGIDHAELRRMAVEYERGHPQEFIDKNLITGDQFDVHIQNIAEVATLPKDDKDQELKQSRWGTNAEVYALSKVLNRPIVVITPDIDIRRMMQEHFSPDLLELTGEPIFLVLLGNHYSPMLLRGEDYFECTYRNFLDLRENQLADVFVKPLEEYQEEERVVYEQAQASLVELSEVTNDCVQKIALINNYDRDINALLESIEGKLALFSRPPSLQAPSEKVCGITFFEGAGLSRDEQLAIALSAQKMGF